MRKKLIVVLISSFTIIGVILFSGRLYKIRLIEKDKMSMNEENTTIIDLTDLDSNVNIEHEHIYKTMLDENTHWQECTICNEKNNVENHGLVDNGWSMGSSCSNSNVHSFSCKCGYSYETIQGRKSHNLQRTSYNHSYSLTEYCGNNCGYMKVIHKCYKSDGSIINCANLGTCSSCGYTYNVSLSTHSSMVAIYNKTSSEAYNVRKYCTLCNYDMGTINYVKLIPISNMQYKFQTSVTFYPGSTYKSTENFDSFTDATISNVNVTNSGTTVNVERMVTFNAYKENGGYFQTNINATYAGRNYQLVVYAFIESMDFEKPTISTIGVENLDGWSKNKTITISGTENYTKSVNIEIVDSEKNVVYRGSSSVVNGKYAVSCTPDLGVEIGEDGKNYTAVVTDACGNSVSKEFSVSHIDSVAPLQVSPSEIAGDWSKNKNFTFSARDSGIGQVSIAVNSIDDLKIASFDGEVYSRNYQFTGDVYERKELSVLYKDELGNTSIEKVGINKLDNTAPTITNVIINNNTLNVQSNDRHQTKGEGSGVSKYRFMTSTTKLEIPEIITENSVEVNVGENLIIPDIYKVKYVYVVAEDKVRKCK